MEEVRGEGGKRGREERKGGEGGKRGREEVGGEGGKICEV